MTGTELPRMCGRHDGVAAHASSLSEGLCMQKHITIYETLKRIGDAEQRKLDTWSISFTSGGFWEPNLIAPQSKLNIFRTLHRACSPKLFQFGGGWRTFEEGSNSVPQCCCGIWGELQVCMQTMATSLRSCRTRWRLSASTRAMRRPPQSPGKSQRCSIALLMSLLTRVPSLQSLLRS